MIIGIVLKRNFLEDCRCIFYLKEDIRRKFQNLGCTIKILIPNQDVDYQRLDVSKQTNLTDKEVKDISNDLDSVNGVFIPDGVKLSYDEQIIKYANQEKIPLLFEKDIDKMTEFLKACNTRKIKKNTAKCVGVPCRYYNVDGISKLYLSEILRRCMVKAECKIKMLIPVQDIDYPTTKGNMIPQFTEDEKNMIKFQVDAVGGILMPGGTKFTPLDRYILEYGVLKDMPILGICLGMQILSCYKDEIDLKFIDTGYNHFQENDLELTHKVNIKENSLLYKILGTNEILTNSFHRKCASPNRYFKEIAYAEDGTIEGLECIGKKFILGVQWHPEISYSFDENSKKIIDTFIEEVKK